MLKAYNVYKWWSGYEEMAQEPVWAIYAELW
jgi:hypothetical protein